MTTRDEFSSSAHREAFRLYNSDIDAETGASFDDWGYAECERRAFVAGAEWAANRRVVELTEAIEKIRELMPYAATKAPTINRIIFDVMPKEAD